MPSRKPRSPRRRTLNADAAGIDVGATSHYVAVPADRDRDREPVRRFASFTEDVFALADWLSRCRKRTVAMEATGVYWIPLFEILERRGFDVILVNARHVHFYKRQIRECDRRIDASTASLDVVAEPSDLPPSTKARTTLERAEPQFASALACSSCPASISAKRWSAPSSPVDISGLLPSTWLRQQRRPTYCDGLLF